MRTVPKFITIGLFAVLVSAGCGDVGDAPIARTGTAAALATPEGSALEIDPARSEIGWRAAKMTRAHEGGFHRFTGTAFLDDRKLTGLEVQIETASIWSDESDLTDHLKDADFFEVETYPTAEFTSDRIVANDTANFTHMITGNLLMHGEVRSISFPATVTVHTDHVRAAGDFIIDRRDWQISYKGQADDLIHNDVRILFDVTAGLREGRDLPADESHSAE